MQTAYFIINITTFELRLQVIFPLDNDILKELGRLSTSYCLVLSEKQKKIVWIQDVHQQDSPLLFALLYFLYHTCWSFFYDSAHLDQEVIPFNCQLCVEGLVLISATQVMLCLTICSGSLEVLFWYYIWFKHSWVIMNFMCMQICVSVCVCVCT